MVLDENIQVKKEKEQEIVRLLYDQVRNLMIIGVLIYQFFKNAIPIVGENG